MNELTEKKPLIPSFKSARVARAQTELSEVDTLIRLDLGELKRAGAGADVEMEAAERDRATPINYSLGSAEVQRQQQERYARDDSRRAKERQRQKVLDDKEEELKRKYDATERSPGERRRAAEDRARHSAGGDVQRPVGSEPQPRLRQHG